MAQLLWLNIPYAGTILDYHPSLRIILFFWVGIAYNRGCFRVGFYHKTEPQTMCVAQGIGLNLQHWVVCFE